MTGGTKIRGKIRVDPANSGRSDMFTIYEHHHRIGGGREKESRSTDKSKMRFESDNSC